MTASTIAKAPPFSRHRRLTSTLKIWNHFPADVAAVGTANIGEVGTFELTHPLLVLLDTIHGSPKLVDQIYAQLLLSGVFHHPLAVGRAHKCLLG